MKIQELTLLRSIVGSRRPDLLPIVDLIGSIPLSTEQREHLRRTVSEEFIQTGTGANDEPNAQGLLLEDLIDSLGHV